MPKEPRARRPSPRRGGAIPKPPVHPLPPSAAERFRNADPYRAEREWVRYEGTPQRELWRELRERFLQRHAVPATWVLDVGSGPGRFTGWLGSISSRRVAFDLSREMLRSARAHGRPGEQGDVPPFDLVQGDGLLPPFPAGHFGQVAILGNTLGFAGASADRLLEAAISLTAPGGVLILEVAPGPGERSRYLARLPASSVARLMRAPVRALVPRIEREGFDPMPFRKAEEGEFRRIPVEELGRTFEERGWEVRETLAVAPALGALASRIERVRGDPKAWAHLLEVEEEIGHEARRWTGAAAVLVAARARRAP